MGRPGTSAGWQSAKGPSDKQKCVAGCGRYKQSRRSGMCRQCEKEAGIIESLNTQIRQEQQAHAEAAEKMVAIATPKPTRFLTAGGREFEVVWDGSK